MRSPFRIRSPFGPPPLVVGVLCAELVVVGALLALGLPWLKLLAFGGPLIGLTLGLLGPTIQELGRRQPRLSVVAGDGAGVLHAGARPWPVDRDRVLANEVAEAEASAENRHSALGNFFALRHPLAIRPSEADHEAAQAHFVNEVHDFAAELGDWLDEYVIAGRAYADTFDVALTLRNATTGAFAEDVTVTIDLPEGVEFVEERPQMEPPPERPVYEPPQPRVPSYDGPGVRFPTIRRDVAQVIARSGEDFPRRAAWKNSGDGRHAETAVGDVHPGRSVSVGEPLLLRAHGPGSHPVRWSAFTKSARKAASGVVTLEVPVDPTRPAFGRLAGITAYPDVPLVDEEGVVQRPLRHGDPPSRPEPETSSSDAFAAIRSASEFWRWQALGLDPADDGPEKVAVEPAERAERRSA